MRFNGNATAHTALELVAPPETKPKARILFATSERRLERRLRRALGGDFHVISEPGRAIALEHIRRRTPDVVICDATGDSLAMVAAIRTDPETQTTAVLMIGRDGDHESLDARQAGADGCLPCSIDSKEFRAQVGAHVQLARARRRAAEREQELRAELEATRGRETAILERINDGFISFDQEWRVTYANTQAHQLLGFSSNDGLLAKGAGELFPHPADTTSPHSSLTLAVAERKAVEFEHHHSDPDLWLRVKAFPAVEGGLSVFFEDITEPRRRERASSLLAAIVDTSDDVIVSKDLNGIITSWNKSAERVFGYTAEEAIGKPITIVIPPDRLDEELQILARLRRGERVDHIETIRRRKDGTLLDISLTISPVRDPHGRIIGASKIARDISERKRAEAAIRELNMQLMLELSAMTRLQQLSTLLVQDSDINQLLREIVRAALDITGADMGNIQLQEDLRIAAQQGFEPPFLRFFDTVHSGSAAGGTAFERGTRVIVEDVATSPLYDSESRAVMLNAGAHAVQSTPLISRGGQLLGVFSTHYRTLRTPSERDLRVLDLLSRQAADLIERKRAEAALIDSEGRFRQLADSMPQIVWTARPDGDVDYYNERWYEFTGFPRNEFGPASFTRILHPEDVERSHQTYFASIKDGDPYRMEYRFWDRSEKRWRWFIGRALPVRDERGRVLKWFGTCTDIDEQKQVEEELRRANRDLEQFAFSASHDLQEPLRSVKIYSELLVRRYGGKLDGQGLEFCNYLQTGATRMEMLVRDLLAYTQIGKIDLPTELTDANRVLQETLADLKFATEESGAHITNDSLPDLLVHKTHLKQVFQNLVGNAIKYRSPDRAPVIHVSAARQNSSWLFSVRDNGIGIEPEYAERIFGLFKRLHTGDQYSGTGIGLAICQRIVERYQGRIWVESQPGEGSTFFFHLPG